MTWQPSSDAKRRQHSLPMPGLFVEKVSGIEQGEVGTWQKLR